MTAQCDRRERYEALSPYEEWVQAGLCCLRAEFPDHGFLVINHSWYAIRGRGTVIVSSGPYELRQAPAPRPLRRGKALRQL